MSSTLPSSSWKTVLASLPLALWARDSFFGLYRVKGTSMEPSLQDGDILLVRKCDSGALADAFLRFLVSSSPDQGETERARVRRYEQLQGASQYVPASKFYECPPTALTGHVVVYKDPEKAFPTELAVKRVVGLGGQWLRLPSSSSDFSSRRLQSIPGYTLHVEGDNRDQSRDSRHVGPISKNLLVGVAEYVVWPPKRWQRIQRTSVFDEKDKPRAFWP